MRKNRFTEEQIIGILREQEASVGMAEVCRRHGISQTTFYKWKSKYGRMDVSEARRLKKLLAETMLDVSALKDLLENKLRMPAARQSAVLRLIEP